MNPDTDLMWTRMAQTDYGIKKLSDGDLTREHELDAILQYRLHRLKTQSHLDLAIPQSRLQAYGLIKAAVMQFLLDDQCDTTCYYHDNGCYLSEEEETYIDKQRETHRSYDLPVWFTTYPESIAERLHITMDKVKESFEYFIREGILVMRSTGERVEYRLMNDKIPEKVWGAYESN